MVNKYIMKGVFLSSIKLIDKASSSIFLKLFHEKPALLTFIFHGLFKDKNAISLNNVYPQQRITIKHFEQFIEYFLNHDYLFISPNDILGGLKNNSKNILVTFDDGYFNNIYSLSILEKYKIPAVFFISTNNVRYNKCFWWDVLYRERVRLGTSTKKIMREIENLKSKTNDKIEEYIIDIFGRKSFKPISDIDRPFTQDELKNFSKEDYVFLGNHTCDHAILTNYSSSQIKSQIINAQNAIYDITGITPIIISYPNGNHSDEIIRIARENGLKIGVTAIPKKNYLPIDFNNSDFMKLGRFTLWGDDGLIDQCRIFRSDITTYSMIRNLS